jgi:DMSO/TMAO reductase YedYZ heme-binding membrane subunit
MMLKMIRLEWQGSVAMRLACLTIIWAGDSGAAMTRVLHCLRGIVALILLLCWCNSSLLADDLKKHKAEFKN